MITNHSLERESHELLLLLPWSFPHPPKGYG